MRRRQLLCVIAGVVAVLAVPAATYWLIGDQSPDDMSVDDLNYYWHPADWSEHAVAIVGRACGALLLTSMGVLGFAVWRSWMRSGWLLVVGCLMAAGFILGASYRMLTGGGVGALIGAPFVPPVVAIVVVGLFGAAALIWQRMLRSPRLGTSDESDAPSTPPVTLL